MKGEWLQPVLVCAAFWLALALHQRRDPARTPRFALSLVAGVVATRLGWLLCFSPEPVGRALDLPGVSVLFLPLGPLLLARSGASFACLPLPIALSRLGCVVAGCCQGDAGALVLWLDAGAFALLHVACRGRSDPGVGPTFFAGFAAIRLCESPWRASPLAAAPVPPGLVASAWLLLALVLAARRGDPVTKPRRARHDPATWACRACRYGDDAVDCPPTCPNASSSSTTSRISSSSSA